MKIFKISKKPLKIRSLKIKNRKNTKFTTFKFEETVKDYVLKHFWHIKNYKNDKKKPPNFAHLKITA